MRSKKFKLFPLLFGLCLFGAILFNGAGAANAGDFRIQIDGQELVADLPSFGEKSSILTGPTDLPAG